jgi:hypothetical protein
MNEFRNPNEKPETRGCVNGMPLTLLFGHRNYLSIRAKFDIGLRSHPPPRTVLEHTNLKDSSNLNALRFGLDKVDHSNATRKKNARGLNREAGNVQK